MSFQSHVARFLLKHTVSEISKEIFNECLTE